MARRRRVSIDRDKAYAERAKPAWLWPECHCPETIPPQERRLPLLGLNITARSAEFRVVCATPSAKAKSKGLHRALLCCEMIAVGQSCFATKCPVGWGWA